MKRLCAVFVISTMLIAISGCVAGPNDLADSPDVEGAIAGFWQGLWHGLLSPAIFLISLFSGSVHPYEVHNNGGGYNFGFLLGVSIVFGGSGGGAAKRRC